MLRGRGVGMGGLLGLSRAFVGNHHERRDLLLWWPSDSYIVQLEVACMA